MKVFIDTQVFVAMNFNYQSWLFKEIISLVDKEKINVYLPEVTKREIESKIDEKVFVEVKKMQKEFKTNAKILRALEEYNPIFELEFKLNEVKDELIQRFHQFITEARIEIISIDKVDTRAVFDKYFDGEPPFSDKKSHEFPDAFSIMAFENKFSEDFEYIHVVSGDKDLKAYCENKEYLIYHEALNSLFDYITRIENDHDMIIDKYQFNIDNITKRVEADIEKQEFMLIDEDGSVHDTMISNTQLDEPFIIEIDVENKSAILATTAKFSIYGNAKYVDYASSAYDSEDNEYVFYEYSEKEFETEQEVPITFYISYDYDKETNITVQSVEVNNDETIEVEIHKVDRDRY
ncbi:PIN domain-containing protein [Alkalicoccus saliphilus]|uniref:DUF4935 domain-containing protein n=1 Tax=Alkalicoccus saliphilus TaxID=200989 RepID=A0A2T4U3W8_9BACI|nr:PIN domain-containing protein [Alkalicoccus saliphilus]PTL38097.1 hypothetical protein C6Y45_12945 [Alkalicoccus saliphilus]